MKNKYYLIVYQWRRITMQRPIISNELWEGSIGGWVLHSLEQPEEWVFLSAVEISKPEYDQLDGLVG